MTTTPAKDFDEAVTLIQAGRCPNDGGALTPMARRSGYGQCAACRFGWAAHTAPAPVIGQDAGACATRGIRAATVTDGASTPMGAPAR